MEMEVEEASPPPGGEAAAAPAGGAESALGAGVALDADVDDAPPPPPCVSLGHDELRCVFTALLAVDASGKSLGRCALGRVRGCSVLACRQTDDVTLSSLAHARLRRGRLLCSLHALE
jgi:hypothetical protein